MVNQVKLSQIVERFDLKNLTPDVDYTKTGVSVPDVNRPALQLTGFFEHFASERVQIIGYVEYTYLQNIEEEKKREKSMTCYCLMRFRVLYTAVFKTGTNAS